MKLTRVILCIVLSFAVLLLCGCETDGTSSTLSDVSSAASLQPAVSSQPVSSEVAEKPLVQSEVLHLVCDFASSDNSSLAGSISVYADDSDSCMAYLLCYADSKGVLSDFTPIATINVTSAGKDSAQTLVPFSEFSVAPAGVTQLALVHTGKVYAAVVLPACKQSRNKDQGKRFAIMSDVHVVNTTESNTTNGFFDFQKALGHAVEAKAEYVCITGDLGLSGNTGELSLFKQDVTNYGKGIPIHCVRGNHDKKFSDDTWKAFVGTDPNYSFERDGVGYVFLSLDNTGNLTANSANDYSSAMDWLEKEVAQYGNKGMPVFVFMHYPLPGQAGLIPNSSYGFTADSNEDNRVIELMNKYTMVVFSGHTHFDFESQSRYNNITVCRLEGSDSYTVHVPSAAYTRNYINSTQLEGGQCYMASSGNGVLTLEGVNVPDGKKVPQGYFSIPLK